MDGIPGGGVLNPALQVIDYDGRRHDFRVWAQSTLDVENLARLHASSPFCPLSPDDRSVRARWTRLFHKRLPDLLPILYSFINNELARHFLTVPTIRCPPMFRVHPPGWDSISPFHKDDEYGLPSGAINVWVPLTEVADSNALWIESAEGRRDFRPVCLRYGQALLFDAVHLTHGSQKNLTDTTRVSFDFRCHGTLCSRRDAARARY